jgi:hypothetical protein
MAAKKKAPKKCPDCGKAPCSCDAAPGKGGKKGGKKMPPWMGKKK